MNPPLWPAKSGRGGTAYEGRRWICGCSEVRFHWSHRYTATSSEPLHTWPQCGATYTKTASDRMKHDWKYELVWLCVVLSDSLYIIDRLHHVNFTRQLFGQPVYTSNMASPSTEQKVPAGQRTQQLMSKVLCIIFITYEPPCCVYMSLFSAVRKTVF